MRCDISLRVEEEARYILRTGATVRDCAKHMGVSKTTVHKDMRVRLKSLSRGLFEEVGEVMDKNRAERHLRGGMATREKYKGQKSEVQKANALGIRD
ncbi:MAG: sporulation transcriptional regulator SpoIIID [Clostridia bacterium]|nr:sporulation transcriptional regulator SpoIIID [Clostridia bacterium]MBQ4618540.1 sporulation transcriptional regulator SpoIIID [Clostridia bacterium]